MTFDLIGLPPSPEEIEAFLRDDSPRALENVVDRLLASPHYGERGAGTGWTSPGMARTRHTHFSPGFIPMATATATG